MQFNKLIFSIFLFCQLQTFVYLEVPAERSFLDYFLGPCKCRCGVPNREARLVGGEHLRTHEFPWSVLIQIEGKETLPGTLINNKYVITGATKLMGLTAYDIKVTLGQFDRCISDISSSNVSVDKILIHPDYAADSRAHDLALVKLSTPVSFDRRVSPICLSFPGHTYLGQVATVLGWHEDENKESDEDSKSENGCRARKTGLPVLGREECMLTVVEKKYLTVDKGCVGVVGAASLICEEDGGGPVMFRSQRGIYELIGVLSERNQCKENVKSTALYTNINDHLSWITRNTKDACYCFKT